MYVYITTRVVGIAFSNRSTVRYICLPFTPYCSPFHVRFCNTLGYFSDHRVVTLPGNDRQETVNHSGNWIAVENRSAEEVK